MGKNVGGVGVTFGGGTVTSYLNNSAAKDDFLTTRTFTVNDLLANDPGSAKNLQFLDNHVVDNHNGTYSLAAGYTGFSYNIQMANGTWSNAAVAQTGHIQQMLQNWSFEADPVSGQYSSFSQLTGWTNLGGQAVEVVTAGYFGIGGDGHWLDTQSSPGGVTVAQTVDVQTGQHATLSFSVAAEYYDAQGWHPGSHLTFSFDGVVVKTITEADFADTSGTVLYNQLKTFTVDVVGQAGADTLTIHDDGTGYVGYAVDWVKLEGWVVG